MTPRPAWWDNIVWFSSAEFDSPDERGSGADHMQESTIRKLDAARGILGQPMHVTSGYRSPAHNEAVGGAPRSVHLTGQAVDIGCNDMLDRLRILVALHGAGFRRLGVYVNQNCVHADDDPTLPEGLWVKHV